MKTVRFNIYNKLPLKYIIFGFLFIGLSCNENGTNMSASNNSKSDIEPSPKFIEFVKQIASKGWVYDTVRVKKARLYELEFLETRYFKKYPFYELDYSNNKVFRGLKSNYSEDRKEKSAISQVKQIWAYFYRKKNARDFISDGVIEQWSYSDSATAAKAHEELRRLGDLIYINTMPYFHHEKNEVFIFHTRAMAFSFDQKPLFEEFIE